MEQKETAIKGEDVLPSMVETTQAATSQRLSITGGDRWFNNLPFVTSWSQFTGLNYHLWTHHIQAVHRPRNLLDHLTDPAPSQTDAQYKRWIVEEEILYIWILDSMTTELANYFIEYPTMKEGWDAAQTYHLKKNDKAKIGLLVIRAGALQQGEKTILAYANELRIIYSELHHYRPSVHNLVEREFTLMDRVYQFLQGLRPEFENLRSLLCN